MSEVLPGRAELRPSGRTRAGVVAAAASLAVFALGLAAAGPSAAAADDAAARVVILANSRQPESVRLAEFYSEQRGVPPANIVALPLPEAESITWREFIDQVYQPLQDELFRRGWIEGTASTLLDRLGRKRYALTGHRLSYLVVCRGVPLRIHNDPTLLDESTGRKLPAQLNKNEAALDAELSLLAQSGCEIVGTVANPLFSSERPSSLDSEMVVKVSRIDGPTWENARGLIISALEGERQGLAGRYYVDLRGPHPDGDLWLEGVSTQLHDLGFDGDVERTPATFQPADRFDAPALYFGWYSPHLGGPFSNRDFAFPPGAIALHIHSFSAQTLHSATEGWCGPFAARGVAATVGSVFEPFLHFTHRPNLLLRALAQGATWGDAVYYSLPVLSWQGVALGDPLYRPFRVSLDEQERSVDRLPPALALYVAIRRANLLARSGGKAEARAVLRQDLKRRPSLAAGLALARLALRENDPPAAVAALEFASQLTHFRAEDWPLAREVAGLLTAHGARPAALRLYATLVRAPAPGVAAQRALLNEAREAADAAGELELSRDFARQLQEPSLVPAK